LTLHTDSTKLFYKKQSW